MNGPTGRLWGSERSAPFRAQRKEPIEVPVRLWIDARTCVPEKLEIRWAPAATGFHEFTETLRFKTNVEVGDKRLPSLRSELGQHPC